MNEFARNSRLSIQMEFVEPESVVRDSVAVMRVDMGYRARNVEVKAAPGLPRIVGDRQKLVQVMVNLIRNAVHATERGKKIIIEVTRGDNGDVVFATEDEGHGVPPDLRERLFNPFVSTKGDQGMGMGLYMARLVVEAHHGRIVCMERPAGKGARFGVRIAPVVEQ